MVENIILESEDDGTAAEYKPSCLHICCRYYRIFVDIPTTDQ